MPFINAGKAVTMELIISGKASITEVSKLTNASTICGIAPHTH